MLDNPTPSHVNRAAINALLDDFLERQIATSAAISSYYQELWADIDRLLHSGGKRLRPQIAVLSYQMFGGKETPSILPVAAALELLHLGMLIHDDVIDRDTVRYGVPNITGSYDHKYTRLLTSPHERRHYADSAAILAGDLLLSSSYLLMAESAIDPRKILDVQLLLGQSIFEVIGGELIDTESAFREAGSVKAETIAVYKTASYSFTLPLLVGATLADVSIADIKHIRVLGANLGIAYQLRDDILGVFGDEGETGKSTSGDIREGKRTFMVEQFYALATDDQLASFDQHFGKPDVSDAEISNIRELLVQSGALSKTEVMISEYEATSRETLSLLTIDHSYIAELSDLIGTATKRTK